MRHGEAGGATTRRTTCRYSSSHITLEIDYDKLYEKLATRSCTTLRRVVANGSGSSLLYLKLTTPPAACPSNMKYGDFAGTAGTANAEKVRQWIDGGAIR
jgi:hypothetical protein